MDVHHPNKGNNAGPGGAIQHSADNDFLISVVAEGTENSISIPLEKERRVMAEKVKDGESGIELGRYTLRKIALGADEDGDPVTTCVVEPRTVQAGAAKPKSKKLKPGTKAYEVWNEFNHCVLAGRAQRVPPGHARIPDGAMVVREQDLVDQCLQKGIGHSDQQDPKGALKARKKTIRRNIEHCTKVGALAYFALNGEVVYWRADDVCGKEATAEQRGAGSAGVKLKGADFEPCGGHWGQAGTNEKNQVNQSGATRGQAGSDSSTNAKSGGGVKGAAPLKGAAFLTPDDPSSYPGFEPGANGESMVPLPANAGRLRGEI